MTSTNRAAGPDGETTVEFGPRRILIADDEPEIRALLRDLLESEGYPAERLVLTVNHPNGTHVIRPADIEKVLKKSVFWEIPHDVQMSVATQTGQPVVVSRPKSRAGMNLAGLAGKLTGQSERPQRKQKSWLRTLVTAGARG